MKYDNIKVGMKLKLVTQKTKDHEDYTDYDWKVGDIVLVTNADFSLKNITNKNEGHYRIPGSSYSGEQRNKWSNFFEPVNQTMKELLE